MENTQRLINGGIALYILAGWGVGYGHSENTPLGPSDSPPSNENNAWVVIFSSKKPIAALKLTSKVAQIYRKRLGNEERAFAVVRGNYSGANRWLQSQGRPIPVNDRHDFGFVVPIYGEVTRIPLT